MSLPSLLGKPGPGCGEHLEIFLPALMLIWPHGPAEAHWNSGGVFPLSSASFEQGRFFSSVFLLVCGLFFVCFFCMLTLGENAFKHRSAAFAAALLLSPQRRCRSVKGLVPTGRWLEGLASTANMVNAFSPRSKPTQTLWVQLGCCELNVAWTVLVLHVRVKEVGWHA